MKTALTVSIIMPLYNKEKWVADTIKSILSQSFKDYELIIINDGSTDSSLEVVKGFKDDRIKVLNQKNSGVSSTRNRGIYEARGKFIAFIDADDIWRVKHLEYLIKAFKRYPDAIYTANEIEIVTEKKIKQLYKLDNLIFKKYNYIKSISNNQFNIHIGSVMFKKDILIELNGFYEDMSIGEDVNLLIRASCMGEAILCNYKGMVYRLLDIHGAMLSNNRVKYLPKYLKGINKKRCSFLVNLRLKKFIFIEYLKKAYQNRNYPFGIHELSTREAGEDYKLGGWSIIPYMIVRFMPEYIYEIIRRYKHCKI